MTDSAGKQKDFRRPRAWTPLDQNFFSNARIVELSTSAQLLFIESLCYAAAENNDGLIRSLKSFRASRNKKRSAEELVEQGLWIRVPDGWQITSWLVWNQSKEQKEGTKKARAEAGRAGGMAKAVRNSVTGALNSVTSLHENEIRERQVEAKEPRDSRRTSSNVLPESKQIASTQSNTNQSQTNPNQSSLVDETQQAFQEKAVF